MQNRKQQLGLSRCREVKSEPYDVSDRCLFSYTRLPCRSESREAVLAVESVMMRPRTREQPATRTAHLFHSVVI